MAQPVETPYRAMFDEMLMRLHRQAMTARDVEDVLQFTRIFYHTMLEQMAEDQRRGREYSTADALAWESKFKELLRLFQAGQEAIADMERQGFDLIGKAEFRSAELDLRGMLSVPMERLQRAAESARQKRGRSQAEVRDALQRRAHG